MRIEIWMDFVCPYCYLGLHRLYEAIRSLDTAEPIELVYRSYELDPRAKELAPKRLVDVISGEYGISLETAFESMQELAAQGTELGIAIDPTSAYVSNTHDAHRLVSYAASVDNELAFRLIDRLFAAGFNEGANLAEPPLLLRLASEAGLDVDSATEVLVTEAFEAKLLEDRELARTLRLNGVPFFYINSQYSMTGAQHPRVIRDYLDSILREAV